MKNIIKINWLYKKYMPAGLLDVRDFVKKGVEEGLYSLGQNKETTLIPSWIIDDHLAKEREFYLFRKKLTEKTKRNNNSILQQKRKSIGNYFTYFTSDMLSGSIIAKTLEYLEKKRLVVPLYQHCSSNIDLEPYKLSSNGLIITPSARNVSYPKESGYNPWLDYLDIDDSSRMRRTGFSIYASFQLFSLYMALKGRAKEEIEQYEKIAILASLSNIFLHSLDYESYQDFYQMYRAETFSGYDAFINEMAELIDLDFTKPYLAKLFQRYKSEGLNSSEINRLLRGLFAIKLQEGDRTASQQLLEEFLLKKKERYKAKANELLKLAGINKTNAKQLPYLLYQEISSLCQSKSVTKFEAFLYRILRNQTYDLVRWINSLDGNPTYSITDFKVVQSAYNNPAICLHCYGVFEDVDRYNATTFCKDISCKKARIAKNQDSRNRILHCKKCNAIFKDTSPYKPRRYCDKCKSDIKELNKWKKQASRKRLLNVSS